MTHAVGLLLVALAASGCTATPPAARAAAPTGAASIARNPADDLVRRVQDVYQKTPQLTARFRQTAFGKMRWDYFSRRRSGWVIRSHILNGRILVAVNVSGKWYYNQQVSKSRLPVAVLFLTGTDALSRDFNARLLTGSKHGATGDKVLELTPKSPSASFKTLVLVVDPASFQVQKSIVTSATGDTNQLSFYQPDTTKTVADAWFVFNPKAAGAKGFRALKPTTAP